MHGLGNDFVIFDQRSDGYSFTKDEIVKIADRNTGIGCDQIILIKALTDYDGELIEFYNSSGEEVMACGNGSRCVANLLMKEKNVKALIAVLIFIPLLIHLIGFFFLRQNSINS